MLKTSETELGKLYLIFQKDEDIPYAIVKSEIIYPEDDADKEYVFQGTEIYRWSSSARNTKQTWYFYAERDGYSNHWNIFPTDCRNEEELRIKNPEYFL